MTDWQRLEQVIKMVGLSTNAFALAIGLGRSETIYQIKRGQHGISKALAQRIVQKYPDINIAWLLTGEGEMTVVPQPVQTGTETRHRTIPYFDKDKPLAVGSLNPQYADGSWAGKEEAEAIIPAVDITKHLGMNVIGPIAPEYLFANGARGEYAAILVMTSVEGFAACSAAAPDETLILSWGLPFLRIGLVGDAGLSEAGRGNAGIKGMLKAVSEALRLRDSSFMA